MKVPAALLLTVLSASCSAMQHSGMSPAPEGSFDTIPGQSKRDEGFDDPKLKAQLQKNANSERHKLLTHEALVLVQLAGELQLRAQKPAEGPTRDEMLREIETIEKLAHNVKERMKGTR